MSWGLSIDKKMRYVHDHEREGSFIQFWPDHIGRFDSEKYYQEIKMALESSYDPIVPAGVTEMRLSELMVIRIRQLRSTVIPGSLSAILDDIEEIINK